MTHEWRDLPALRGRFHPDYPDAVQVLVHDGGPRFTDRRNELVWVRIVMAAPTALTGVVLNQPEQLTSVQRDDRIQFVIPQSGEYLIMVRDKYLAERGAWIVHPCSKCGLTELFDAPSDLIAKTLNIQPGETLEAFTAFCGVCHGVQVVESVAQARDHVRHASGGMIMNYRALARILFGIGLTLLGLLWLLQGADLVHIRPILCVANCKPLEGGSVGWMTTGALVLVVGLLVIASGVRRRRV